MLVESLKYGDHCRNKKIKLRKDLENVILGVLLNIIYRYNIKSDIYIYMNKKGITAVVLFFIT